MVSLADFSAAQELIGKNWRDDQSAEQAQILGLARDALDFISTTGQRYQFEDFLRGPPSALGEPPDDGGPLKELMRETERFFTKLFEEAASTRASELAQVILDTLRFISSTCQSGAFAEYLEHLEADAPPFVVASFDTREEAEAWLRNHPSPPDFAQVLVADQYHDVVFDRETNFRALPRSRALHHYFQGLEEDGSPVASFNTREEAEAWLQGQPRPARRAWVSIGNEHYLAVYHPNIHHRVLYPFSRRSRS
jgi:hypothetical protein